MCEHCDDVVELRHRVTEPRTDRGQDVQALLNEMLEHVEEAHDRWLDDVTSWTDDCG
jgi:hypothetical protein